jgi:predicted dehydrogenase
MTKQHLNPPDTTRRTFLKAAVGAAVAATAPEAPANTPNLRIGVVGTGSRGCDLLRKLVTIEGVTCTALCDDYAPHLAAGEACLETEAFVFENFEKMLEEAELDAVIVATPLHQHFSMCVAAIQRGIPVFCEKAMCLTLDEGRRLRDLVQSHDAIFQVGLQRRSNAVYDQADAMVQSGMLGTITAIKCQWHRNDNWRRPMPVAKDHPDYQALERRLNWRLYDAYSQGLMAELGSHQIDVVNRILGAPPRQVTAMGGIDHWQDGRQVYDNIFCNYEYQVPQADGSPRSVRVTYSAIQSNAHEGSSELILGTKGTLLLSQKLGQFYREGVEPSGGVDGTSGATLQVPDSPWAHRGKPMEITSSADDTRAELLAFAEAVRTGNRKTVCDAGIGLENCASVYIANEAITLGRTIPFPTDCVQA